MRWGLPHCLQHFSVLGLCTLVQKHRMWTSSESTWACEFKSCTCQSVSAHLQSHSDLCYFWILMLPYDTISIQAHHAQLKSILLSCAFLASAFLTKGWGQYRKGNLQLLQEHRSIYPCGFEALESQETSSVSHHFQRLILRQHDQHAETVLKR